MESLCHRQACNLTRKEMDWNRSVHTCEAKSCVECGYTVWFLWSNNYNYIYTLAQLQHSPYSPVPSSVHGSWTMLNWTITEVHVSLPAKLICYNFLTLNHSNSGTFLNSGCTEKHSHQPAYTHTPTRPSLRTWFCCAASRERTLET